MNLDDFVLSGWPLVAWLMGLAALAILLGQLIGRLNERDRQRHERSRAWRRGVYAGMEWEARSRAGDSARPLPRDPYSGKALAPMPPRYVIPTPPRAALFDQDEPTEAGRAIELRGDD